MLLFKWQVGISYLRCLSLIFTGVAPDDFAKYHTVTGSTIPGISRGTDRWVSKALKFLKVLFTLRYTQHAYHGFPRVFIVNTNVWRLCEYDLSYVRGDESADYRTSILIFCSGAHDLKIATRGPWRYRQHNLNLCWAEKTSSALFILNVPKIDDLSMTKLHLF